MAFHTQLGAPPSFARPTTASQPVSEARQTCPAWILGEFPISIACDWLSRPAQLPAFRVASLVLSGINHSSVGAILYSNNVPRFRCLLHRECLRRHFSWLITLSLLRLTPPAGSCRGAERAFVVSTSDHLKTDIPTPHPKEA